MDIIALLIEFVKAQGYTSSFCRNLLSCILTVMVFNLEPTISRIALFLPVNAELRHRRKHLQRFLLMLDERIFKVLFKLVLHVLGKPSRIVVAIDWTQIGKRYLFLAAITIDGRTLPIAFLLRENKSVQDKKEMVSLIGRVISDPVEVTIVADGEFFSPKFLDCVKRSGFHYVIRTRKNVLFNGTALVKYSDSTKDLWFGKYTSSGYCARVIINRRGKDSYFLVTDLRYSEETILEIYLKRFWIEETFRDYKTYMGFGKYSKSQSIDRLFGLAVIYSFSYVFAYHTSKSLVRDNDLSWYLCARTFQTYLACNSIFLSLLNSIPGLFRSAPSSRSFFR